MGVQLAPVNISPLAPLLSQQFGQEAGPSLALSQQGSPSLSPRSHLPQAEAELHKRSVNPCPGLFFFFGSFFQVSGLEKSCVSQALMEGVYKLGDLVNFQLGPACIQ